MYRNNTITRNKNSNNFDCYRLDKQYRYTICRHFPLLSLNLTTPPIPVSLNFTLSPQIFSQNIYVRTHMYVHPPSTLTCQIVIVTHSSLENMSSRKNYYLQSYPQLSVVSNDKKKKKTRDERINETKTEQKV